MNLKLTKEEEKYILQWRKHKQEAKDRTDKLLAEVKKIWPDAKLSKLGGNPHVVAANHRLIFHVHRYSPALYSCALRDTSESWGYGATPEAAYQDVLKNARFTYTLYTQILKELEAK